VLKSDYWKERAEAAERLLKRETEQHDWDRIFTPEQRETLRRARNPDSASEEQDEGRTPDQSWIVALHNLRICADELNRIGHGGEARMIEDAVNRIVAFRQHIAAR